MSRLQACLGNCQALLRSSQPQKEEVTLKTEEKQRELTCHVVAGGITCWFTTSFAGFGQDHSGCLGKKNTNTSRKTAELLPHVDVRRKTHCMKVIWTCFGFSKQSLEYCVPAQMPFFKGSAAGLKNRQHNRKYVKNHRIAKMPAKNNRERSKE